jgi:hypothetical protein
VQSAECFYNRPRINSTADRITPIHQIPKSVDDQARYLVKRRVELLSNSDEHVANSSRTGLVVVAGDMVKRKGFDISIATARVELSRRLRALAKRTKRRGGYSEFQLLEAKNPTFDGAIGAALWSRLRMEAKHYCRLRECGMEKKGVISPLDGVGQKSCTSTLGYGVLEDVLGAGSDL